MALIGLCLRKMRSLSHLLIYRCIDFTAFLSNGVCTFVVVSCRSLFSHDSFVSAAAHHKLCTYCKLYQ